MRVHELIEASIEYIAYEGAIGCEPLVLQQYLATQHPTLDATYFTLLYTHLLQYPAIQLILTSHPLPSTSDGSVREGTAPLPADHVASTSTTDQAEVDISRMRGREMIFHLAGEKHLTDEQTMQLNKEEKRKAMEAKKQARREAARVKAGSSKRKRKSGDDEEGGGGQLVKVLEGEDDGGGVQIGDLAKLEEKWGSRLRLRCTDDEVYARLTGSHQKNPRLTPIIFHALQLVARSRENGITAIELAPLVGTSQGSMHYFMRILLAMGLCAKVQTVLHGSTTNLFIFHRFVEQNEHIQALTFDPLANPADGLEDIDELAEDGNEDGDNALAKDWGLNFTPLTERDLLIGTVIKERLVRLLDHPMLENHLLKASNLMRLLGWQGPVALRHKRSIPRHLRDLITKGIVERLEVGDRAVSCLRLTKYNPDFVPPTLKAELGRETADDEGVTRATAEIGDVGDSSPYEPKPGISLVQSIEHQITQAVVDSGTTGLTINDIRDRFDNCFKRTIESHISRTEEDSTRLPLHLRNMMITSVAEQSGREHRMRFFSVDSFRKHVARDQIIDETKVPVVPPQAGEWSNLSARGFAKSREQFEAMANVLAQDNGDGFAEDDGHDRDSIVREGKQPKQKAKSAAVEATGDRAEEAKEGEESMLSGSSDDDVPRKKRKQPKIRKYTADSVQTRGRPRKYVYVVDEEGQPTRRVIGNVPTSPELPQVLIWYEMPGRLVPAPEGYSGVGKPPFIPIADVRKGYTPGWFDGKATGKGAKKGKGIGRGKGKRGRPAKREASGEEVEIESGDERDTTEGVAGAAAVEAGGSARVEDGEARGRRTSGRVKKETNYRELAGDDASVSEETPAGSARDGVAGTQASEEVLVEEGEAGTAENASVSVALDEPQAISREITPAAPGPPDPELSTPVNDNSQKKRKRRGKTPVPPPAPSAAPTASAERSRPKRQKKGKSVERESTVPTPSHIDAVNAPTVSGNPALSSASGQFSVQRQSLPPAAGSIPASPVAVVPPETPMPSKAKGRKGKTGTPMFTFPDAAPTSSTFELPAEIRGPTESTTNRDTVAAPPAERETTPLKEITPAPVSTGLPPANFKAFYKGRVDLGTIQKAQEIYQVLLSLNGVQVDHKLIIEHRQWTHRVHGTDTPAAPSIAYGMDRTSFRKVSNMMVEQNVLKQTTASVPTPTGRWIQAKVLYLPETPQETVHEYIRGLGVVMMQAYSHPKPSGSGLPQTGFTEVRLSTPRFTPTYRAERPSTEQATPSRAGQGVQMGLEASDRRLILLRDQSVVSNLYGFKTGRCARLAILHKAIVRAFAQSALSSTIIATSPRIFALPLLFEQITAKEYFSLVAMSWYDEELEAWLNDPANAEKQIKDIPRQLRPPVGFRGAAAKNKLYKLLSMLTMLKVVVPLDSCPAAEATLSVPDASGNVSAFRIATDPANSLYYQVFDYVPVYHTAEDPSMLLGVLPIREIEQTDEFWNVVKRASMSTNAANVQQFEHHHVPPGASIAAMTDALDISMEDRKSLRSRARWAVEPRLQYAQKSALDALVGTTATADRLTGGKPLVADPAEIAKVAWEYAIPLAYAEQYVTTALHRAVERRRHREVVEAENRNKDRERRERVNASIRQKVQERQSAAKEAWQARVRAAAEKVGAEYSTSMVDFAGKQMLMQSTTHRGEITEQGLEEIVRLYLRSLRLGQERNDAGGVMVPPPRRVRFKRAKEAKPKPGKDRSKPMSRRRRNWSTEDDEVIFDCEAIIRARARGKLGPSKGRAAMVQLWPDVGPQTFLLRLKKVMSLPGRPAYFERLESAWYDLWVAHRGTEELPDDFPDSMTDFDLKKHLAFLRERIAKFPLRLAAAAGTIDSKDDAPELPATVSALHEQFKYDYRAMNTWGFHVLYDGAMPDITRSQNVSLVPMLLGVDGPTATGLPQSRGMTRAMLKMVLSTPDEVYDSGVASRFLKPIEFRALAEMEAMKDERMVVKHKSGANGTDRLFTYSVTFMQLSEGPLPGEVLDDARAFPARLEQGASMDWPLISKSGEVASFLGMISNHEVDFDFDYNLFPTVQYETETYNTRKLTDASFEFDLHVTRSSCTARTEIVEPPPVAGMRTPTPWLQAAHTSDVAEDTRRRAVEAIRKAGPGGITKNDLFRELELRDASTFTAMLASLSSGDKKVFWAGYDTARLVHSSCYSSWACATRSRVRDGRAADGAETLVNPRRWVSIYGERVDAEWHRAVKAVLGHIVTRPGMHEMGLRTKLALFLDRMEQNDVLEHLLREGRVRRAWIATGEDAALPPVEATDVSEEGGIAWWPGCI